MATKPIKQLIAHYNSRFRKKGKNFMYEVSETIQILKNLKNEVSNSVSRMLEYEVSPEIVLCMIPPARSEEGLHYLFSTAHVLSNLTLENFRNVKPQYTVFMNPVAITAYAEERFPNKKEQFIKGLLAEEFSHVALEEKYELGKLQLELFTTKKFKGKQLNPWYVLDYIYILGGKSEALAMYIANQVAETKIYTPKRIVEDALKLEVHPEDFLTIGGVIGDRASKLFAAKILKKMKGEEDFRGFLHEVNEVSEEDLLLWMKIFCVE